MSTINLKKSKNINLRTMLSYVTCYQPKIINLLYGHFHEKTFTHMSYHVHDFIEYKERRWCYLLFLKNKKNQKKSPNLYFKVNKKDLKLVFHFHISKHVFNSFYTKAFVFKRKCKNMKINSKNSETSNLHYID